VVIRKAKIGEVEFRMVAKPASTVRSAQAMSVNGITLFKHAWMRKRRHVAWSRDRPSPRQQIRATRMPPAINVRAAISVTGGMVATPILMKV
jgi:hypothetical protein